MQRYRQHWSYPMRFGWDVRFVSVVKDLLFKWGLQNAPVCIAEDGTALQARVSVLATVQTCAKLPRLMQYPNYAPGADIPL